MKKRQDDIRRSPLQLSNYKNNCKLETRNKIETMVASRVLMNMELVEVENANQLCFFALGDSSSSSSSPSVSQRSRWCLLVCLKEQASTKIHFRSQICSERKPHTLKQNKRTKKTPRPSTKPYHTGALPPPSPICKTPMQGGCCGKGKHAAAEHVLGIAPGKCHAETPDRAGDLQIFSLIDALPTELSQLCAKQQMLLTTLVHNYIILFWSPRGQGELGSGCCGPRGLEF